MSKSSSNKRRYNRSAVTGRFITANTPESQEGSFETYADGVPVVDESGMASPNTIDVARPASGDGLAQGDRYRPGIRRPELIELDRESERAYGRQGALLRDAARWTGADGVIAHITGLTPPQGRCSAADGIIEDGRPRDL